MIALALLNEVSEIFTTITDETKTRSEKYV